MTIMVAVATLIGFVVLIGGLLLVHRSVSVDAYFASTPSLDNVFVTLATFGGSNLFKAVCLCLFVSRITHKVTDLSYFHFKITKQKSGHILAV